MRCRRAKRTSSTRCTARTHCWRRWTSTCTASSATAAGTPSNKSKPACMDWSTDWEHTLLFDLSGKVALVTGGNGGIGLGIARGLAEAGADVAVAGRNNDKTTAAVAELTG